MAQIKTYGDLKEAVKNWANTNEPKTLAEIPNFINFAEKDIANVIRCPIMEKIETIEVKKGSFIGIPDDVVQIISVLSGEGAFEQVDYDQYLDYAESGGCGVREDDFIWSRIGTKIALYPLQDEGTKIRLVYYQDPPEMTVDEQKLPLLTVCPQLYLYSALSHCAVFQRKPEDAQFWEDRFNKSAAAIMENIKRANWTNAPKRMR